MLSGQAMWPEGGKWRAGRMQDLCLVCCRNRPQRGAAGNSELRDCLRDQPWGPTRCRGRLHRSRRCAGSRAAAEQRRRGAAAGPRRGEVYSAIARALAAGKRSGGGCEPSASQARPLWSPAPRGGQWEPGMLAGGRCGRVATAGAGELGGGGGRSPRSVPEPEAASRWKDWKVSG